MLSGPIWLLFFSSRCIFSPMLALFHPCCYLLCPWKRPWKLNWWVYTHSLLWLCLMAASGSDHINMSSVCLHVLLSWVLQSVKWWMQLINKTWWNAWWKYTCIRTWTASKKIIKNNREGLTIGYNRVLCNFSFMINPSLNIINPAPVEQSFLCVLFSVWSRTGELLDLTFCLWVNGCWWQAFEDNSCFK